MDDLEARIAGLRARVSTAVAAARGRDGAAGLKTLLFGRKSGLLTHALQWLKEAPAADKARVGALLNELKREAETAILALESAPDVRDPGTVSALAALVPELPARGQAHPLSRVRAELEQIFLEMGYSIALGPELEDDFHNFEALNVPAEHPSRDMQDTLYMPGGLLLRTHTSNVQIRTLETTPPPFRIIAPGRCYRRDTPDLTHSPVFHQIEGLVVDEDVTVADLKGTLEQMSKRLFGSAGVRLRPSYFPFTEPSAELDIACFACEQRGCPLCKRSGWIELGGCGMVDPNVFAAVGVDPEKWTGFAFGFGIDRAAMLKHGIDNIRLLFDNDLRFLRQFPVLA